MDRRDIIVGGHLRRRRYRNNSRLLEQLPGKLTIMYRSAKKIITVPL